MSLLNLAASGFWLLPASIRPIANGPPPAAVWPGATKPTYDIWGDTVNVASRLESSGISGRIQVSEQVAQALASAKLLLGPSDAADFELECRGPIEVKGKGILTTYLVVTPFDCAEQTDGSLGSASNDGRAGASDNQNTGSSLDTETGQGEPTAPGCGRAGDHNQDDDDDDQDDRDQDDDQDEIEELCNSNTNKD